MNCQVFKLDLEKAEEPETKFPTSIGSWKKQESSSKTSTSALLTAPKPLIVWITTNWKTLKEMGIPPDLPSEKSVCRSRSKLEPDMEKQTGSKLGKEYVKAIYCHPAYLTYMQSTPCDMLGCMKHKLESTLLGEISIPSDMQMTPPLWQKVKN